MYKIGQFTSQLKGGKFCPTFNNWGGFQREYGVISVFNSEFSKHKKYDFVSASHTALYIFYQIKIILFLFQFPAFLC